MCLFSKISETSQSISLEFTLMFVLVKFLAIWSNQKIHGIKIKEYKPSQNEGIDYVAFLKVSRALYPPSICS